MQKFSFEFFFFCLLIRNCTWQLWITVAVFTSRFLFKCPTALLFIDKCFFIDNEIFFLLRFRCLILMGVAQGIVMRCACFYCNLVVIFFMRSNISNKYLFICHWHRQYHSNRFRFHVNFMFWLFNLMNWICRCTCSRPVKHHLRWCFAAIVNNNVHKKFKCTI